MINTYGKNDEDQFDIKNEEFYLVEGIIFIIISSFIFNKNNIY